MVPISGIAPGDRLYLRHRSTRLLPSRYMQTVVSTGLASSKDTPHDVRPHSVSPPIEYSTEPADSMESLRIVRDSKPMGEAQGPLLVLATSVVQAVDQHLSARRPPTSVDQRNTARHQRLVMSEGNALQTMRSLLLVTSPHVGSYAGDRPRARSLAPRSCWQIVSRTPCSWQLDAPFSTLLQSRSGFP